MDEFKRIRTKSESIVSVDLESKPKKRFSCCIFVINCIMAYFFFVYSFRNPDKGQCFAKDAVEAPSATAIDGYTNVSKQFEIWFISGLVLNCGGFIFSSGAFLYALTEKTFINRIAIGVALLTICGMYIWGIYGCKIRWQYTGDVCSGKLVKEAIQSGDEIDIKVGDAPY